MKKLTCVYILLGPLVTMMGKMVKNMIYFIVLLLIILMSFGVSRQAILKPDQDPTWMIARDVSRFSIIPQRNSNSIVFFFLRYSSNRISCCTVKYSPAR